MSLNRAAGLLVVAAILVLGAFVRANAQLDSGQPERDTTQSHAEGRAINEDTPAGYALPPELAAKASAYARARRTIYFLDVGVGILALLLILRTGLAVRFRNLAERAARNRFCQAAVFAPLLLVSVGAVGLPFSAARHHLAVRYGLSVQSWGSWLADWVKSELIAAAVGIFLVWLLYAILRRSPRRWWAYVWLCILPVLVFGVFIYPVLIEPLFFRFTPLAETHPALASELGRVARRAGEEIPANHMYVMDASSKYTAMNAYVTGLGASRRVVVWDTALARMSTPEIVTVFGHEMGHYVLGHVANGTAFAAGVMLLFLFAASRIWPWVVRRWGAACGLRGVDDWASLPVLLLLVAIGGFLSAPLENAYSRHVEHEADVYGLEVTHGVVPDAGAIAARSLQALGEAGLSEVSPSRMAVIWFYSHPPLDDRIVFARTYDPWAKGSEPRFVK